MENHLEGLPEYGVLLTGSPENPVIENRSGRTVLVTGLTADIVHTSQGGRQTCGLFMPCYLQLWCSGRP